MVLFQDGIQPRSRRASMEPQSGIPMFLEQAAAVQEDQVEWAAGPIQETARL
jgi:hypothetical protein